MECRVVIVQHGEKERQHGDPGLTDAGDAQAGVTADWIGGMCRPARIVSSPMRRAVETAAPIASATGLQLATDDRLRERMNWADDARMSLDDFLAEWRRSSSDRTYVPRSGDSSEQAAERFLDALREFVATAANDDDIIVVAHGGVTVDCMRTLVGDERLEREQPNLISDGVPCCAVTELLWDGSDWDVRLPSTGHLTHVVEHRPA